MPFPTRQGTQASIAAMCDASTSAGRDTHLLSYAAGVDARPPAFTVHRAGDFPRVRSLRSGPSADKVALDARMTLDLARLWRALRPDVVVAHHVEAAAIAAAAAPTGRFVWFVHTDLGAELPSYAPARYARALARLGHVTDRVLARRARGIAAISPMLADTIRTDLGANAPVRWVPVPWTLPAPVDAGGRARAREALGLAADAEVVLYAGNLDAYQGWEDVVGALARLAPRHPRVRLLVGTESDAVPVRDHAARAGVGARVDVHGLGAETTRRLLHAAADVVVVPRRAPGGLPIKLLDALARGKACVCAPLARAGLPLDDAVAVTPSGDAAGFAHALEEILIAPGRSEVLGAMGRAYVAREHTAERYQEALDALARPRAASRPRAFGRAVRASASAPG